MEWRMLKMVYEDEKDGMEIWPLDDIPDRKHQLGRGASAKVRHHAYRKKTKTSKKKNQYYNVWRGGKMLFGCGVFLQKTPISPILQDNPPLFARSPPLTLDLSHYLCKRKS